MKWFSHRRLLLTEAILVAGLAQLAAHDWLMNQHHLSAALRVVLGMAMVVGVFGGLFLLFQRSVTWGLHKTVSTVKRGAGLATTFLPHALLWLALFAAYAWFWGLDRAILAELTAANPL
jgi:hypothetical protein